MWPRATFWSHHSARVPVCLQLTYRHITQDTIHRFFSMTMNNEKGGSCRGLIKSTIRQFGWRNWGTTTEISVKIVDFPVGIRTWPLQNISQKRNRLIQPALWCSVVTWVIIKVTRHEHIASVSCDSCNHEKSKHFLDWKFSEPWTRRECRILGCVQQHHVSNPIDF